MLLFRLILLRFIVFIIIYLLFSFVAVDMNIMSWPAWLRFSLVCLFIADTVWGILNARKNIEPKKKERKPRKKKYDQESLPSLESSEQ